MHWPVFDLLDVLSTSYYDSVTVCNVLQFCNLWLCSRPENPAGQESWKSTTDSQISQPTRGCNEPEIFLFLSHRKNTFENLDNPRKSNDTKIVKDIFPCRHIFLLTPDCFYFYMAHSVVLSVDKGQNTTDFESFFCQEKHSFKDKSQTCACIDPNLLKHLFFESRHIKSCNQYKQLYTGYDY